MTWRIFYRIQNESQDFWAIEQQGIELELNYGPIGSKGLYSRKGLANTAEETAEQAEALIVKQIQAGFTEVSEISSPDELPSRLRQKLLEHKLQKAGLGRSAWLPLTEAGDTITTASKFSGRPWLHAEENWPLCQNCQKPLQLMLQLNTSELPAEMREKAGTGLIQLFYCVNTEPFCAIDCEAWYPFAKSVLARQVQPDDAGSESDLPDQAFPAKRITGWEAGAEEYPSPAEAMDLLAEHETALTDNEYDLLLEEMAPAAGEKLGGWPAWAQGVEYPLCPDCKEPMEVIFQLDSDQNLPHGWGDMGVGHLSLCQRHPETLAFGWAC